MNTKRKIALVITVVAIAVFCITLYRALFYAPTDEIPLPEEIKQEIPAKNFDATSIPLRLEIPKLSLDAKVVQVGITRKGNMATPDNFSEVGWFKYGFIPGQVGSAVLAGHVDNGLALPGVFKRLDELSAGDDVYVTSVAGEKLHFIVTKSETFAFDAKNTDVFTEADGKLLKLITCTGTWVQANKTHDKRLVVTARLSEN